MFNCGIFPKVTGAFLLQVKKSSEFKTFRKKIVSTLLTRQGFQGYRCESAIAIYALKVH